MLNVGHLIILWLQAVASLSQGSFLRPDENENMKTCLFPWPEDIHPCACKEDENFQIFLICNIQQDMDEKMLSRLNDAFGGCRKEIYGFNINLNNEQNV